MRIKQLDYVDWHESGFYNKYGDDHSKSGEIQGYFEQTEAWP